MPEGGFDSRANNNAEGSRVHRTAQPLTVARLPPHQPHRRAACTAHAHTLFDRRNRASYPAAWRSACRVTCPKSRFTAPFFCLRVLIWCFALRQVMGSYLEPGTPSTPHLEALEGQQDLFQVLDAPRYARGPNAVYPLITFYQL